MKKIIILLAVIASALGSQQAAAQNEQGVKIGGVIWATKNVGADKPEGYGNYYTWYEAMKACPAGWRTPTVQEFEALDEAGSIWTTVNGVKGRKFGSGGNTIFIPAAGYRDRHDTVINHGSTGSCRSAGSSGYTLWFNSTKVNPSFENFNFNGLSVRCVRK